MGAAFTTGEYDLYTDNGMLPKGSIDTAKELVLLAVLKGVIERRGAWYYFNGTQIAQGQDNVIAIAVENGDVTLAQSGSETLLVRAVFGDNTPAQRMPNSAFTFAVENNPSSTATGTTVGANTGVITAATTPGTCIISVNLTGYTAKVEPAYVMVTVTGE